ncbi:MAG TPA: hypothetical protein ENK51_05840, partial [Gammaproteobacteria bacterium]|nr:hypothetical protein [Gammaproteobacteria bacterium]
MAEDGPQPRRHFILDHTAQAEPFRRPGGGGGGKEVPRRNRQAHGSALLQQMEGLEPALEQAKTLQQESGVEEGFGLQIEFESFPDIELAFESLAAESSGIELRNVRHEEGKTLATVFVPDGKLQVLENKIKAYLEKDTPKGEPRNQKLIDAIRNIRVASIRSLWTDDPEVFPTEPDEAFWWEVWLPVGGDRLGVVGQFKQMAQGLGFRVAEGRIEFPERTVLLVYGSLEQMQRSVLTLNSIAELRRAKETADFFDSLPPEEQPDWVDELLQRMTVPNEGVAVPHVCLLDTGVNIAHPLLAPLIRDVDTHTVGPGWGTDDQEGHGTEMAGLALFGDLTPVLDLPAPVEVE